MENGSFGDAFPIENGDVLGSIAILIYWSTSQQLHSYWVAISEGVSINSIVSACFFYLKNRAEVNKHAKFGKKIQLTKRLFTCQYLQGLP